MNADLVHFRHNAAIRNLCGNYSSMWDKASDREQLVRLATDSNGISYMCESMENGWGLSPDFIRKNFTEWCDGREIRHKGYKSAMLCEYTGGYVSKVTELLVIGCNGINITLSSTISEVYICQNSRVTFDLSDNCTATVHLYGNSNCNALDGLKIVRH